MTTQPRSSQKASSFTESVIREMTRLAQKHGAVNLSQGFPDFPAPQAIKQAACDAILGDINQYAVTWGAKPLARRDRRRLHARGTACRSIPTTQITVCCGSTEAMMATMLAIVDPGDEVIVFEPFYENYGPDAILSGATPRFVRLREPGPRQAGLVATTPTSWPRRSRTGRARSSSTRRTTRPARCFTRAELEEIAALCRKWDAIAVTDEIYDHILYDGAAHVPMASLDGMAERTVTINSVSKTFSVTGWRVGWTIAPADLTAAFARCTTF